MNTNMATLSLLKSVHLMTMVKQINQQKAKQDKKY